VFDQSSLPVDENIRQTKQAVEALKAINPNVLVEGEIGNIGSGSGIHDHALPCRRSRPLWKRRNTLIPPVC